MEVTATAKLRRMVLEHLARYTWENRLTDSVYNILEEVQENTPRYRCCVFKERAVLKNRIQAAFGVQFGLNIIDAAKYTLTQPERKDLPIMDVLPAACDQCPIDRYYVSDACRHCLTHKCMNNCPKGAISVINNRAFIDHEKCIECGRCKQSCPYGAILEIHRPCVRSCGTGAISINKDNRKAEIDQTKCVQCGACRNACPFGAIDERSQIVRIIMALKNKNQKMVALLAPSVSAQFGFKVHLGQVVTALKQIGFDEIVEVGVGADITAAEEAQEFMDKVPAKQKLMTSSCCPAFVKMIKKHLPNYTHFISDTPSPMISTAKWVKENMPDAITVFIGPCIAKKAEARENGNWVNYVMTFEELSCILQSRDIEIDKLPETTFESEASKFGLSFPLPAGVTAAVVNTVEGLGGTVGEHQYASGLSNCMETVTNAVEGKLNPLYIEGMACQNGCIDGPASLADFNIIKVAVKRYADSAKTQNTLDTEHAKAQIKK